MPEHSPAPRPQRGIYGFALLLCSCLGLLGYCVWAFVPDRYLPLTYYWQPPQKYWALAIPVYCSVAVVLFVVFMCGLNYVRCADALRQVGRVQNDFGDTPFSFKLN